MGKYRMPIKITSVWGNIIDVKDNRPIWKVNEEVVIDTTSWNKAEALGNAIFEALSKKENLASKMLWFRIDLDERMENMVLVNSPE